VIRRIHLGDNLEVLRDAVPDASVDLVYLDPPFNSGRNHVLCARPGGGEAGVAFTDVWRWTGESEAWLAGLRSGGGPRLAGTMAALSLALGKGPMAAYLAMLAPRIAELARVLKPAGSLYLHCDATASHYLALLLDAAFGPENLRSKISWKRTSSHNCARRYGPVHDEILFYTKGAAYTWNRIHESHGEAYLAGNYRADPLHPGRGRFKTSDLTGAGLRRGDSATPWRGYDPGARGRHWAVPTGRKLPGWLPLPRGYGELPVRDRLDFLDSAGMIHWPRAGSVPHYKSYLSESPGVPVRDLVLDIPPLSAASREKLDYPTQKPLALLERFVAASSNPGDLVLDPFCGSGTTLHAAENLERQWIGVDSAPSAVDTARRRMAAAFPGIAVDVAAPPGRGARRGRAASGALSQADPGGSRSARPGTPSEAGARGSRPPLREGRRGR
jgi:DNA modification methylase